MASIEGFREEGRMNVAANDGFGAQLRAWRHRRRLSQLDLALEAEVSARHLSFVETGRSRPSRDMVLKLADTLALPLRERNTLLRAAGFAPAFEARALDDPLLQSALQTVQNLVDAHAPFPALAVDRHWNLVLQNRIVPLLLGSVAPALLEPPVNVLRLSLHPEGLSPNILNLAEWKAHLIDRVKRQVAASGDPVLELLLDELKAYPAPASTAPGRSDLLVVPFILAGPNGPLSFISTTTMFGTPVEVTLSEIAVESFFPADPATAETLRQLAKN
jgi:transcriptional regulator with XRE-family HTH domain